MTLEHLRHPHHRTEAAPHGPCVPPSEESLGGGRVDVPPEPAEQVADPPGPGGLQPVLLDRVEAATLLRREVRLVEEPELPRSLEPIVVPGLQGLVLCSPHLIHRLSEVLGDVELVVDELCVRHRGGHSVGIGRKHVGGDGTHPLPLLDRQRLEDRLGGGLGSFRSHIEDSGAVDVREDGDVVLAPAEVLLVDANVLDRRGFPTLEPTSDRPVHDRLHGIPGEAEQISRGLHGSAGLQDFDGESLEEESEARVLARPRWHDRLHAVLRAPAPGETGDQLRRELHRVQVPPTPLFRVVGEAARLAAVGATDPRANVGEADLDASLLEPEVDRIDSPGLIEAQQPGVVGRKCVHPDNLRRRRPRNDQ